jgi:hypothetical protein
MGSLPQHIQTGNPDNSRNFLTSKLTEGKAVERGRKMVSYKFEKIDLDLDLQRGHQTGQQTKYDLEEIKSPASGAGYLFTCAHCEHTRYVRPCPNCNGICYVPGQATDGRLGIVCSSCGKGFTRWICKNCRTDNAIAATFGKWIYDKGCLIATAAFGNTDAQEVLVLRKFRDSVLLNFLPGKVFVYIYYAFSPALAIHVSRSEVLKRISRVVLSHIVHCLQRRGDQV